MSSTWNDYPDTYRESDVQAILRALRAGDCAAVIGLSGAGKSNLTGFLAQRKSSDEHTLIQVDCNQLASPTRAGLLDLIAHTLAAYANGSDSGEDPLARVNARVARALARHGRLTLIFDRFDALPIYAQPLDPDIHSLLNNLRALRDRHKFALTYVLSMRRPLPRDVELAELFFANTLWLRQLSDADARWNVARFAKRRGETWPEKTIAAVLAISGRYPSLLKAACEAVADGCALDALATHDAFRRRLDEFRADAPDANTLARSGLSGHPLLGQPVGAPATAAFDTTQLTAKEYELLKYFVAHPNRVCEKDELIRAVWSEDKAFVKGIRDDSLAQLVRRLREKIESDPSRPKHIVAVPGRGYRFVS
jgi:Transcriptional regulatory protein, C terminal/AAA domain